MSRPFAFRLLSCVFLLAAAVPPALAGELRLEPARLTSNAFATITVFLEGDFADRDSVELPLKNLVIVGEPSVSSEFALINGTVSRRKTFRYRARPIAPGAASAGPLVLTAEGRRETLPERTIEVVPDRASASNEPEVILRELLESGREPLFVVAEPDRTTAYVGEPVVVTWTLYNASEMHRSQVVDVPALTDFWSEELKRSDEVERVTVGGLTMQRLPIRRAVLYPLRSGRLRVSGITLDAAVLRPRGGGPLAMFEGDLVEVTFTSAPFEVDVRPLPPGPPVDAVGSLSLECTTPLQRAGGPVTFSVLLRGTGNLRASRLPSFQSPVAGTWKTEGGEVTRADSGLSTEAARRWQYLLFPREGGPFEIPSLALRVFDPASGERKLLRCEERILEAAVTPAGPPAEEPAREGGTAAEIPWRVLAAGALVAAGIALAIRPLRTRLRLRREVRRILAGATPQEIRERVDARTGVPAATLLSESSDRGDAYRALRSLLDAAAHDRDIAVDAEREIGRRVREVLRESGRSRELKSEN